jgi:hypothetical protein
MMIRQSPIFLATAALLTLSTVALAESIKIEIGSAISDIVANHGRPLRTIDTGEGTLHFYGPTLLYVTNGIVDFVSMGSEFVSLNGAADAAPPAPAPVVSPSTFPSRLPHEWNVIELKDDERLQQDRRQQRIVTRIKRVAINRSYDALRPQFQRSMPMADAGNILAFKDSRGRACPAFGDAYWPAWYSMGIEVESTLMAP